MHGEHVIMYEYKTIINKCKRTFIMVYLDSRKSSLTHVAKEQLSSKLYAFNYYNTHECAYTSA